jgi:hypothetical protein
LGGARQASFFFLFGSSFVLVLIVVIDFGEFQRFCGDHLIFGATFIAGDYVAFFDFIFIEIEYALTFRANRHAILHQGSGV